MDKFCTGCGVKEGTLSPHTVCCPDSRFRTVSEILDERSEGIGRIADLEERIAVLARQLHIAIGMLSTHPKFAESHPDDVLSVVTQTEVESR